MPSFTTRTTSSLLQAASEGYPLQLQRIEERIAELRSALGAKRTTRSIPNAPRARGARRTMSPEGRKRIAEATRKQWAAYRRAKAGK